MLILESFLTMVQIQVIQGPFHKSQQLYFCPQVWKCRRWSIYVQKHMGCTKCYHCMVVYIQEALVGEKWNTCIESSSCGMQREHGTKSRMGWHPTLWMLYTKIIMSIVDDRFCQTFLCFGGDWVDAIWRTVFRVMVCRLLSVFHQSALKCPHHHKIIPD